MGAAHVPLDIDQGEDWTANVIFTDDLDQPQNVIAPCRMDIKNRAGQVQLSLALSTDDPLPPDGVIPPILLSSEIGLIQIHIEDTVTAGLIPGVYLYDLFCTVDDGNEYSGPQIMRLIFGEVTVNKRVTVM